MNYSDFLPLRGSDPLRKELWALYSVVEKYFLADIGFELKLQRVNEATASCDSVNRSITVPFDPSDRGALFHEVTHDLFHHSVFHRLHNPVNRFPRNSDRDANYNETWGEGFCDAVRWLMEMYQMPGSPWLTSYSPVVKSDWRKQRAERILNHTGQSLAGFALGWRALVAGYDGTADYLNKTVP